MPLSAALANSPITDKNGLLTPPWGIYFRDTDQAVAAAPSQPVSPVTKTNQAASIVTTAIPSDPLAPGLYRVTFSDRITTVDGVSSSLIVTITWTDGGVTCSVNSPALTSNTTASVGSGTFTMFVDGNTPVSYATTYVSNTPGQMKYKLAIVLERLSS